MIELAEATRLAVMGRNCECSLTGNCTVIDGVTFELDQAIILPGFKGTTDAKITIMKVLARRLNWIPAPDRVKEKSTSGRVWNKWKATLPDRQLISTQPEQRHLHLALWARQM